jgi:2-keto-4-pentenoate hydratase/2-oxohepta-3-ene-1,7-dioic acid hydratase (catechol pathway)
MGWPFEELIAYASRGTEVRAGDVLGSGTCGNGGCLPSCGAAGGASTRRHYARVTWSS